MPRAFVIGNAAWDEVLHLAALPAPGASVHVRRGAAGPGGKGLNQAVVLARAGIATTLVAALGRDARGDALAAALAAEGLAAGLTRVAAETDWSAILVTDAGDNAVLTTRAAADALDPAAATAALAPARPGDLCLLQGNLTPATTAAAVAAARAAGLVVAINPSPVDPAVAPLLPQTDLVVLNRAEAVALAGADTADALRRLAPLVVLTRGAEGALRITATAAEPVAAVPVAVVDPTAAGDAFLAAALAHAAPRGWRPDAAALAAGAAAAALAVARPGAFAALPTRTELARLMSG
jgi:ribokinase